MKNIKNNTLYVLLCFIAILSSCTKDEEISGAFPIAKVNVINAIVDGGKVKVNVAANAVPWSSIPDNSYLGEWNLSKQFILPTDKSTLFKVVPLSDTTRVWYDEMAQLNAGKMYTLYLSGTPTDVKTLFQEETDFPDFILRDPSKLALSTDSIVNIRFVNLSPSGPQVDINIQGMSTLEGSDLGYQQFTDFKSHPATKNVNSIVFEVRRSSDQQLVSTYYFNADYFRFKSVAIVMMGIYDPDYLLPLAYTDRYRIEAIAY